MFYEQNEELRRRLLLRTLRDRSSAQGPHIVLGGREVLNFASNDYLGLACHHEVVSAAQETMDAFGFGSGASRLLSGGCAVHRQLESEIARFKGTQAALLFNSGYAANTGIIPAITGPGDIIISDELNHASIIDGCRLSRAKTFVYRHRDTAHLLELLRQTGGRRQMVVTDSVFSMDGDIAPLREIHAICASINSGRDEPCVIIYIDDAHGTGVLGSGRGALAHFNIPAEPWILQMGTFSKALGSFGAFAAGSGDAIQWVLNNARSFIFATALPACVAAASLKALGLLMQNPGLVRQLWEKRDLLVRLLRGAGYTAGGETPIITLSVGDISETIAASDRLMEKGIYVPAIRPPTVREPRLRITVTAAHSGDDIEALVMALKDLRG